MAQQHLTLERIFGNPPLAGPTPRLLKLSPDGRWLTSLRNRADEKERFDLWALDTKTGAERMLVDSKSFGTGAALSEAERMQREVLMLSGADVVTASFLVVAPDTGGFTLGAFEDGKVLGVAFAYGGYILPEPFLYSDFLAVVATARSIGVGY